MERETELKVEKNYPLFSSSVYTISLLSLGGIATWLKNVDRDFKP